MQVFSCVLRKELLVTARQPRLFVLRAGFVGILLLALWAAFAQRGGGSGPETMAFRVLRYVGTAQFWAIALVVPGLTAAAIAAEHERRTLPLLLISHLKPARIVIEKVLVRLLMTTLLLAAGVPVLLVLLRFGRVTVLEILGVYTATLSGMFMAAAAGLIGAGPSRRLPVALVVSYLVLLVAWAVPLLPLWTLVPASALGLHPTVLAVFSPPYALTQALDGTHDFWLYGLLLAALVIAAAMLWACRRLTEPTETGGDNWARRLYDRYHRLFTEEGHLGSRARVLARRRLIVADDSETDPVLWRESRVRFVVSHTFILRCAYVALILLMLFFPVLVLTDFPFGLNPQVQEQRLLSGFSVFLLFYVPLLAAYAVMISSAMIAGERERQTLDVLLTTPMSGRRILTAKLLGLVNPISIFCVVPFVVVVLLNLLFQSVGFHAVPMVNLCQVFVLCYLLGVTAGLVGLRCSARRRRVDTAMLDAAVLLVIGLAVVLLVIGLNGGFNAVHGEPQELLIRQLQMRGSRLTTPATVPGVIAVTNALVSNTRGLWIFIVATGATGIAVLVHLHRHVDRLLGRL